MTDVRTSTHSAQLELNPPTRARRLSNPRTYCLPGDDSELAGLEAVLHELRGTVTLRDIHQYENIPRKAGWIGAMP